jgi:AraC family transcriptional regulator of adaptative response/methylated-DNA-[protein]-cysteine methyltransferase
MRPGLSAVRKHRGPPAQPAYFARKRRIARPPPNAYAEDMLQSENTAVRTTLASEDWRWAAVMRRDRSLDGRLFYAVTSTGVFCRPGCPSRRPRRDRVRFFDSAEAAAAAGFRPCRRCHPTSAKEGSSPAAIERATAHLAAHADETVPLAALARVAGMSPFHLQRQFKKALGVSPREFQSACRADRFRGALRAGRDVAAATYEAGYGSPSRVYEATPTGTGMSPGTYRRAGAGMQVGFVTLECDLGWLLVAATAKGVCAVKLGESAESLERELRGEFSRAQVDRNRWVHRDWVRAIADGLTGGSSTTSLPLDVQGTAFQWRVWRALQAIPPGETRSYSDVAAAIGQPSAARAVARACASNPVCLVVPCHRVVAKQGAVGGYRWGVARKQRLLKAERKAK